MADIGESLQDYLIADTDVNALVSGRVNADRLIQGTSFPVVVYRIISTTTEQWLSTSPMSVAQSRIQFDAYAVTRPAANQLAEKIRLRLQNKRGTIEGSNVSAISPEGSGVSFVLDPEQVGTDQPIFVATQDFLVTYQTATS